MRLSRISELFRPRAALSADSAGKCAAAVLHAVRKFLTNAARKFFAYLGGTPILLSGASLFSATYHVGTRNSCYLRTYFFAGTT